MKNEKEKGVKPFGPFKPSQKLLEEHLKILSEGEVSKGKFKQLGWEFDMAKDTLKTVTNNNWDIL